MSGEFVTTSLKQMDKKKHTKKTKKQREPARRDRLSVGYVFVFIFFYFFFQVYKMNGALIGSRNPADALQMAPPMAEGTGTLPKKKMKIFSNLEEEKKTSETGGGSTLAP